MVRRDCGHGGHGSDLPADLPASTRPRVTADDCHDRSERSQATSGLGDQASTANRARLEQLVDTLSRLMGPRDSVRVQALSIRPAEKYQEREIVGYDPGAVIEVTLRNLEQLPAIFDAAFANGATISPSGVRFRSDRADVAMDDALGHAFADARRQAGALAEVAGMSLGPIVEITTQPRLAGFRVQDVRLGVAAASVTPSDVPSKRLFK